MKLSLILQKQDFSMIMLHLIETERDLKYSNRRFKKSKGKWDNIIQTLSKIQRSLEVNNLTTTCKIFIS